MLAFYQVSGNMFSLKNFLVPDFLEKLPVTISKKRRNCFQLNWQIRPLWTLEVYPNDPEYCYSKRVIYIDPEGWVHNLWGCANYDQKGRLWRSWSQIGQPRDPETHITAKPFYTQLVYDHLSDHSS